MKATDSGTMVVGGGAGCLARSDQELTRTTKSGRNDVPQPQSWHASGCKERPLERATVVRHAPYYYHYGIDFAQLVLCSKYHHDANLPPTLQTATTPQPHPQCFLSCSCNIPDSVFKLSTMASSTLHPSFPRESTSKFVFFDSFVYGLAFRADSTRAV